MPTFYISSNTATNFFAAFLLDIKSSFQSITTQIRYPTALNINSFFSVSHSVAEMNIRMQYPDKATCDGNLVVHLETVGPNS